MTARRSSATERRGVGITPRPAALSAAVLTVLLTGSGCASRNANTLGTAAPVVQGTAAVALDGGLPHTPPGAAHMEIAPSITALPSTTSVLPPTTEPTDPVPPNLPGIIQTAMTTNRLTIGLTPEQNPASPKPVLEVVGMPTWLWIEGLPPALQVTVTPPGGGKPPVTFTVWAAMDTVIWRTGKSTDATSASPEPVFTCGNGTSSPSAGQGYGVPFDVGFDASASGVPNACVNTFSAPYYATSGASPTAGVYTLTGAVNYHIAYTVTDSSGKTSAPKPVPNIVTTQVVTQPTRIRVGEIQALAISP